MIQALQRKSDVNLAASLNHLVALSFPCFLHFSACFITSRRWFRSGITNFDLLGNFGRLEWLGNFYLVFSYNLLFAVVTVVCLTTKFTASVRTALLDRLAQTVSFGFRKFFIIRHAHSAVYASTHVKDD